MKKWKTENQNSDCATTQCATLLKTIQNTDFALELSVIIGFWTIFLQLEAKHPELAYSRDLNWLSLQLAVEWVPEKIDLMKFYYCVKISTPKNNNKDIIKMKISGWYCVLIKLLLAEVNNSYFSTKNLANHNLILKVPRS